MKKCSALVFSCLDGLPAPPAWFNYSDVRSQWELVKPLWLFSSGALLMSLPRRWHCPASHQLNYPWNILPHASSDDALCWDDSVVVLFSSSPGRRGVRAGKWGDVQGSPFQVWKTCLLFLYLYWPAGGKLFIECFWSVSLSVLRADRCTTGHGCHDNSSDTGEW